MKIIKSILIIIIIFIIGILFKDITLKDSFANIFEVKKTRLQYHNGENVTGYRIFVDTQTGVNYLWYEDNYKGRINSNVRQRRETINK